MAKVTGRTVKTYMSMACKVECESCGTSFVCEQTQKLEAGETAIIGEIDAGLTTGSAFDKLEKKKAETISKFKQMKKDSLPTAKCPKCGYWQSWMIASEKNSRIQLLTALLGIIIFAAIFGGSAILKLKGDPA